MRTVIDFMILGALLIHLSSCRSGNYPVSISEEKAAIANQDSLSPKRNETGAIFLQISDTILGGHRIKIAIDTSFRQCVNEVSRPAFQAAGLCFVPITIEVDGCKTGFGVCTDLNAPHPPLRYFSKEGRLIKGNVLLLGEPDLYAFGIHFQGGYQGLCLFRWVDSCPEIIRRCAPLPFNDYVYFSETNGYAYHAASGDFFAPYDRLEAPGTFEIVEVKKNCFGFLRKKITRQVDPTDIEMDDTDFVEFAKTL